MRTDMKGLRQKIYDISRQSPESVNVLIRHQILDEEEAILLIEEPLRWGQHVTIKCISTKIDQQIFNTLLSWSRLANLITLKTSKDRERAKKQIQINTASRDL